MNRYKLAFLKITFDGASAFLAPFYILILSFLLLLRGFYTKLNFVEVKGHFSFVVESIKSFIRTVIKDLIKV